MTGPCRAMLVSLLGAVLLTSSLSAQPGHSDSIEAAAFTPDGKLVCTVSDDRAVGVWDGQSGQLVRLLRGHADSVIALAMAPEGSRAISLDRSGEVRVWEIEAGRCLLTFPSPASGSAVAMAPSGRQIITDDARGGLTLRDPFRGEPMGALPSPRGGENSAVWSLLVTPRCRYAVAGYMNGLVRVWDYDTRQWLRDLPGPPDQRVWSLATTPDGNTLFAGFEEGAIAWDLQTGQRRFTMGIESAVLCLGVTPDGRYVLTAASPAQMWDVQSGQCVRTVRTLEARECPWAFSPDCRRLMVASETDGARVVRILPVDLGY